MHIYYHVCVFVCIYVCVCVCVCVCICVHMYVCPSLLPLPPSLPLFYFLLSPILFWSLSLSSLPPLSTLRVCQLCLPLHLPPFPSSPIFAHYPISLLLSFLHLPLSFSLFPFSLSLSVTVPSPPLHSPLSASPALPSLPSSPSLSGDLITPFSPPSSFHLTLTYPFLLSLISSLLSFLAHPLLCLSSHLLKSTRLSLFPLYLSHILSFLSWPASQAFASGEDENSGRPFNLRPQSTRHRNRERTSRRGNEGVAVDSHRTPRLRIPGNRENPRGAFVCLLVLSFFLLFFLSAVPSFLSFSLSYIYMYVYMYICMYVCTFVCMYAHICM